ncbi:hypothetical protein KFL_003300040 [Klebsormidium nitens]|uniref:Glutaredoxin domain-containing protein n=1 Tax=Klebsormidium nitens TaxID=105231 RepID=A0A1Y1IDA7_KLENI|nr:hypothetical protein KFL_003300040 [Klebsormidium nitens]|eukprot:GAQ87081.1 hypothetical protein KFL_003300040 [Klebsormidium nitens]
MSTSHGILEAPSLCRRASLHCKASGSGIVEEVKKKNEENPVIVYSKSWCPYCSQVKGLFRQLGVPAKVIELDEINEEEEVQDALYELTRQATVPNVFIGGKHIGGCDDTMALKRSGKLFELLADAGINVTSK